MLILGLNSHEINSSCAFLKNGKLQYASTEERFSRNKLTKNFPINAIEYFFKRNKLSIENVNYVVQSWNPSAYLVKFNPLLSTNRTQRENYFYTIPDNILRLKNKHGRKIGNNVEIKFDIKNFPKVYFLQHHDCHAGTAFYMSNFEKAAILISDYKGEFESTSFHLGHGNKIKRIKSFFMPDSLGMFYSTITEFLGYKPDQDEWKVMALSAIKNNDKSFIKEIKKLYSLLPNGEVRFNQEYFRGKDLTLPNLYTPKLVDLFGKKNFYTNDKFSEWHVAVANALQFASEEICVHFLNELHKITKQKKLVVGGGFFMNSVFNGKIIDRTPFQDIYIPYAPTDAGNSIGAALYLNHNLLNKPRVSQNFVSQIGPDYDNNKILKVLNQRKINYVTSNNIALDCAKLILKYGFIGYFEGKSEFGDRALGNRSILGDPRFIKIKDQINSAIKYRESYRPFAPVTIKKYINKFFEVDKNFQNNFMEKVVKIKKKYSKKLAAVSHYDNSARIQTVDDRTPNKVSKILIEFEKLTGFPILLNTSFNVSGEPMVLSPEDAINTFYKSGLTVLVLNNIIITKFK
jgi:carbamoyltransferase